MGIAAVLFIWTIFAVVGAGVAGIGVLVWRRGAASRSKGVRVAGIVTFLMGAVGAVSATAFVVLWVAILSTSPTHSQSPEAFRAEFGFLSDDVEEIQSMSDGSTDYQRHFLSFRCSQPTITKIVGAGFSSAPFEECLARMQNVDESPSWWVHSSITECYVAEPFDEAFSSNVAWLSYDQTSNRAYFYYYGVD